MRKRWYYRPGHPKASPNGFVLEEDLGTVAESRALDAPILMDRFYENTATMEGIDIGSRRKHKAYMKENGYTHPSDFTGQWAKAAEERKAISEGKHDNRARREDVARALYQIHKP
jgi:hypothetical protein